ncbi:MAG: hypothetical protein E7679_01335 [Ruminococcaceae bacterium]|nr:hypothetical protein [Oscillospiraceae bacterium]
MEKKKNTIGKGFLLGTLSLVLALLLIALNIASLFLPSRFSSIDITPSRRYALSDQTGKFIEGLEEDITLYVLNADGSDKGLEEFIKRYAASSKHIKLERVDTVENPDFLAGLGYQTSAEISAYTVIVKSEKRSYPIDPSNFYYYYSQQFGEISASDYSYYLNYFGSSEAYAEYYNELAYNTRVYFRGEMLFSLGIDYVIQKFIPHAYFITGRGEDSVSGGNFASFLAQYGYNAEAHDITTSAGIPEDAGCIVINSPSEDYTEAEAKIIIDYLKDGGRMLLLTDAENASMKNLMSIMDYYGATVQDILISEDKEVSEEETQEEETQEEECEQTAQPDPHEIETVMNFTHDVFALAQGYTDSVKLLNANPITLKPSGELRDSQLVSAILSTTDKAYTESADNKGAYTVGVVVEEETENGTTGIVWLTGADAFNKSDADSDAIALPFFSFYWANREFVSEFATMDGVPMGEGTLTASSNMVMWLGVVMILLIPFAILCAGTLIYFKRRKV